MSPGSILPWLPVIREVVELGQWVADRVRARRAKRKAAAEKAKKGKTR